MSKTVLFFILGLSLFFPIFLIAQQLDENSVTIYSPLKQCEVKLQIIEGDPYWSVKYNQTQILSPSKLGLILSRREFKRPFSVQNIQRVSKDEVWTPVWGKSSSIRDNYNEVRWVLVESGRKKRTLSITIRAYDDGVAIKYGLAGRKSIKVQDDNTHFSFPKDFICWSENEYRPGIGTFNSLDFIGPVKLSQYKGYGFPITVKVAKDCYTAILEAGIYDFSKLLPVKVDKTTFRSSHAVSKVRLPIETSWRVLLFGKTPGDLLTSNVMVNLNPPSPDKDYSWLKTGLSLWDWRQWGAKDKDGFTYGLDMPSWKRQIDFASTHNIGYLMLDAGWYGLEHDPKSNPLTCRRQMLIQPDPNLPSLKYVDPPENWDPIDIQALIHYAKDRNVDIILYLNDVIRQNYDFEETLATYKKWGAAGIKYGFMADAGQAQVAKTREIVDLCGKYELICNLHDELVLPSGDRRNNPHYLSREFCHSQADGLSSFTPSTFCTAVFTNMLAGPLDMNNGYLTLTDIEKIRPKVFKVIHSTVVSEAARVLIVFSGLAVLPDTPASYESKSDLFEFISKLPMNWDETIILNGKIGHYITTARRSGNEWFIASACNEKGATLPIKLDFLKPNKQYRATLYEDSADSHYITNKDVYKIRRIVVQKDDIIKAKLAPGGGHCIYLEEI